MSEGDNKLITNKYLEQRRECTNNNHIIEVKQEGGQLECIYCGKGFGTVHTYPSGQKYIGRVQ